MCRHLATFVCLISPPYKMVMVNAIFVRRVIFLRHANIFVSHDWKVPVENLEYPKYFYCLFSEVV
jgi:hypothetical protein